MKIKLIVGFRRDQEHSIPADEAHKAYYLFLNPESRGVFSNGLAIKGSQIEEIVPDWQGTMGWNATHVLDSDDWNEMRSLGVAGKMNMLLAAAKDIAQVGNADDLGTPLTFLIASKYPQLAKGEERREGDVKSLKDIFKEDQKLGNYIANYPRSI